VQPVTVFRKIRLGWWPHRVTTTLEILALLLLVPSLTADGQPVGGTIRIGWLATAPHPFIDAFRQGLRELGHFDGRDIWIEERYAGGHSERLVELAGELVRLKVNVVVTSGLPATAAAKTAITTIPVVSVSSDPVGAGLVASLARPGGNITGLSMVSVELSEKWIQLIKEAIPSVLRLAVLSEPGSNPEQAQRAEAAAKLMGLQVQVFQAGNPEEIEKMFRRVATSQAGAMIVLSSVVFAAEKRRLVALAMRHRLPSVYEHRDFVEAGGLISYGPDFRHVFRRAAGFVDRILKGAKPGDLPLEQPTRFELVINLKTAKTLRLTIPESVLSRADEVIR
jgi:putative ABC transport system substrate-binding protein